MGDQNSRKTTVVAYLDIILVVLGQGLIAYSIFFPDNANMALFFAAVALSSTGLGIAARRTGRSVLGWVLLSILFMLVLPLIAVIIMHFSKPREVAVTGEARPLNVYLHGAIALTVFAAAAFAMDSVVLSVIAFIVALIAVSPRRRGGPSKGRALVIGMYALMLVMTVGMKLVNLHVSRTNAEVIIKACERYRDATGGYPAQLGDLVPAYLPKIPAARYTLTSGGFYYYPDRTSPPKNFRLLFINEAPFARSVYNSDKKDWHSID